MANKQRLIPQTRISIRMDTPTKVEFENIVNNIGLNMGVAVNAFAKSVIKHRGIPFDLTEEQDPFFSPYNQRYIQESFDEAANGNVIRKTPEELGLDNEEY